MKIQILRTMSFNFRFEKHLTFIFTNIWFSINFDFHRALPPPKVAGVYVKRTIWGLSKDRIGESGPDGPVLDSLAAKGKWKMVASAVHDGRYANNQTFEAAVVLRTRTNNIE